MARPANMVGTATTKPAMGPAMPISKRAARDSMKPPMRMNAPRVPISVGAGMKKGRVARTPIVAAEEIVSQLVSEQNSHDRERKWNAEQKRRGILPEPLHGEQGQEFVAGGKGFQVVIEVELQARAHQDRGAEGEQQHNSGIR